MHSQRRNVCIITRARRVTVVAHVDDFLCVGSKEEQENLLRQLQSLRYECQGEMLGPDTGETREVQWDVRSSGSVRNPMVGKLETRRGISQRVRSANKAPHDDSWPIERGWILGCDTAHWGRSIPSGKHSLELCCSGLPRPQLRKQRKLHSYVRFDCLRVGRSQMSW